MASRISHRSRRSSRSFSRLTWKRAMGMAAVASIATMATVMMSSTSVRPDWGLVGCPALCDEAAKDRVPGFEDGAAALMDEAAGLLRVLTSHVPRPVYRRPEDWPGRYCARQL